MEITFSIEYRTQWGEELKVLGSIPSIEGKQTNFEVPLTTLNGVNWTGKINLEDATTTFNYEYVVTHNNLVCRKEANRYTHLFSAQLFNKNTHNILLQDTWLRDATKQVFFNDIFNNTWYKKEDEKVVKGTTTFILEAFYPMLTEQEELVIIGNQDFTGNWNENQPLEASSVNYPYYYFSLNNSLIQYPLEYKFAVIDKASRTVKYWEHNNNRYIPSTPLTNHSSVKIAEGEIIFSEHPYWKGAGVAVPVFSLKSKKSWGVGEFLDLIPMANWAKESNLKLIQILPINDTTSDHSWADSYPYKCSSVFALNPIYLNLEEAGIAKTKYKDEYFSQLENLNNNRFVDFPFVQKKKLQYIEELCLVLGTETLSSPEYCKFYNNNQEWLLPYATYIYFRKHYQTDDIEQWEGHRIYSKEVALELYTHNEKAKDSFKLSFYTQYSLFRQLKEAANYAKKNGIALKGDLPIGISKQSVDAWQYPKLFNLSSQAGAPPDAFAEQGQNWGFPTYNWEEMRLDNYSWWENRLKHMSNFYAAFRIDHILGFFRIWSIPDSATYGTLGQFDPALPYSLEEIESFGFIFERNKFTEPYITEEILNELFSEEELTFVYKACLNYKINGLFEFKPEYNSQKLIMSSANTLTESIATKLCELHSYVLFVIDDKNKDRYHPRIDAAKTPVFKALNEEQQQKFMDLYNHFFYHRHNDFWKEEAYKKLPALIQASNMLVCGEDLGMIPATVPEVMNNLSILSLEVARMPKAVGLEVGNPSDYPYASVSTFATHDMSTLRGWWNENKELRNFVSNHYTPLDDTSIDEISTEQAFKIISLELNGGSMLCIEALQDWLALSNKYRKLSPQEEQINIPADSKHKWRFRMPCHIEDLISDKELNNTIKGIINKTHRG